MAGLNWKGVESALSSAPPKPEAEIVTSGGDFEEANFYASIMREGAGGAVHALERWVDHQVTAKTRADLIPNYVLRRMGVHPMVYLAEFAITGLARRPNLFHVKTSDDVARAETEEWMWKILPQLVPQICRAYVFGTCPIVIDWRVGEFKFEGPTKGKGEARQYTRKGFVWPVASHDLWLDEVGVVSPDGRTFAGIEYGDTRYPPGRSMLSIWDRQFGSWIGESARRRAASPWLKSLVFELLQAQYLERSVDPPRVIKAPSGTVKDSKGKEVSVQKLVRSIFASLRNAGVASLPSDLGSDDKARYEIQVMDLPDRSDVWLHALNRFDEQILTAYLVPPGITGVQDVMSGGGARVTENLFGAFLEILLEFLAGELTQLVEWCWEKNHLTGAPPEILPNRLPERMQKLYLEVLKLVGGERVGQVIDVNALLGQLDVAIRADAGEAEAAGGDPGSGPGGRPPGRPRDATGEREKRREDAESPEGQDDTGAPREDAA